MLFGVFTRVLHAVLIQCVVYAQIFTYRYRMSEIIVKRILRVFDFCQHIPQITRRLFGNMTHRVAPEFIITNDPMILINHRTPIRYREQNCRQPIFREK
ncbi:hypothetical protein R80B4_01790 [Fibrobacteres bacterium R8-0-B4]